MIYVRDNGMQGKGQRRDIIDGGDCRAYENQDEMEAAHAADAVRRIDSGR